MKVLHLFNDYLPNSMNWAKSLIENTPDCHIFVGATRFLKTNFFSPQVGYVEFPLRCHELSETRAARSLIARGCRQIQRRFYSRYLRAITGDVDIVHCHFATAGWNFRHVAMAFPEAKRVVSFYGYDYEKVPHSSPVWRERYGIMFDQVDRFICEGEHGRELLSSLGAPPDKVSVCRLGISPDQIVRVRRQKGAGSLHLVQVATYTEKKGHIYSLRAFAKARLACPNLRLTFVGHIRDAESREILQTLEQEVRAAGLADSVAFLLAVPYSELHQFLHDFHVFLQPSTYSATRDCEGGAPIVLLDAQATGMPVISTRHCDIPGEVIHEETGLLAAERDIDELGDHMRRFYEMGQIEYDRFVDNARLHVERQFDVRVNGSHLRRIYADLCATSAHDT